MVSVLCRLLSICALFLVVPATNDCDLARDPNGCSAKFEGNVLMQHTRPKKAPAEEFEEEEEEENGELTSLFKDVQPLSFSPKGCFNEKKENRAVGLLALKSEWMTVQTCAFHCRAKGMQVFALTDFNKCHCSNDKEGYSKHGQADENNCNAVCEGGDGICGGHKHISVFVFDEPQVATDLSLDEVKEVLATTNHESISDQTQIHETDPRAVPDQAIVHQGDMAVSLAQLTAFLQDGKGVREPGNLTAMLQLPSHHPEFIQLQRTAIEVLRHSSTKAIYKWPNGVVKYRFNGISQKYIDYAKKAFQALEAKTCLTFQEVANGPGIEFIGSQGGCWSYVGYVADFFASGWQQLNLGAHGCDSYGVVAHEIGHALGMHHEHSRADRDQFIKTFPSRFTDPAQFEITNDADTKVPYDIGSLMHYNPHIFTTGGPTMEPKVPMAPGQQCCGTYAGFTDSDIKQLNEMYGCSGNSGGGGGGSSSSGSGGSGAGSTSGSKCCSEDCQSNSECGSGLFCCPYAKKCMGSDTKSTVGSNCNACANAGSGSGSGSSGSGGSACCYETCASSSDCAAGLFCCPGHKLCMDQSTKSTRGPSCDVCQASSGGGGSSPTPAPPPPSGPGACCYDTCASSGDCATGLFCCPGHKLCMDKTTSSTVGPTCDSLKDSGGCAPPPTPAPTPAPPLPTSTSVPSCDFETSCSGWASSGQYKWDVKSGRTPTSSTGPDGDHTTGAGKYTFVEASGNNNPGKTFILESAPLALSSDASISFWYSMNGGGMGDMMLEAKSNGAFNEIWKKSGHQGTNWQQAKVTVSSDVTGLRFKAITGTYFRSDFALDDITSSQPTTAQPTSKPTSAPTSGGLSASQQQALVAAAANIAQSFEDALDGVGAAVPEAKQGVDEAKIAFEKIKGALTQALSGGGAGRSLAQHLSIDGEYGDQIPHVTPSDAAAKITQGLEDSLDGVAAAVPDATQGVSEAKVALEKVRAALSLAFGGPGSSLSQLLGDDDYDVERPSGDCSELEGAARSFCEKKEMAHTSNVDASVRVVGAEATRDHEISITITDPAPSVSEYQYVQFTSDQLRSKKDAIILVPADAELGVDLPTRALRKVLVPPINPLARSTDTFGVIAIHLNPDVSPDAIQRTKVQALAPGAYKLAYVRELATQPEEKFVFSEVFQVLAGVPSRPGNIAAQEMDGKVKLSWKPSLFSGGSKSVLYEIQYYQVDCTEKCDWITLDSDPQAETSLTLDSLPDGCNSDCKFRSRAINEYGYSKPGYVV